MARLSSVFTSLPRNAAARRRIYREARLGSQPKPYSPNTGDALYTITAVARFKQAYENNKPLIPFLQSLSNAWAARKDWRP